MDTEQFVNRYEAKYPGLWVWIYPEGEYKTHSWFDTDEVYRFYVSLSHGNVLTLLEVGKDVEDLLSLPYHIEHVHLDSNRASNELIFVVRQK